MKVFISYASPDLKPFRVADMAARLENTAEIERAFYWDRDSTAQKSIVKYMEESITVSDVILIVCTEASNDSGPVQQETDMAVYLNKRIVPIFRDINDVRISLRPKRGVKYYEDDFDLFFKELFMVVTETLPEIPKEEEIAEFHGIPLVINEYRAMKSLEGQLGIIIPPIEPFCKDTKIIITIDRKNFKGDYGFTADNNHVIQFNFTHELKREEQPPMINFFPEALSKLSYLRALNLSFQKISIIPSFIGKMTQLEYLDLRGCNFKRFPKTLSHLKNLKVFLFRHDIIFPKKSGRNLITQSNLDTLKSLIITSCKLDLDAISFRPTYQDLKEMYEDVYCYNCGHEINLKQIDFLNNKVLRCPECKLNRFYVFTLKEED
jgi:hypothetical protein